MLSTTFLSHAGMENTFASVGPITPTTDRAIGGWGSVAIRVARIAALPARTTFGTGGFCQNDSRTVILTCLPTAAAYGSASKPLFDSGVPSFIRSFRDLVSGCFAPCHRFGHHSGRLARNRVTSASTRSGHAAALAQVRVVPIAALCIAAKRARLIAATS